MDKLSSKECNFQRNRAAQVLSELGTGICRRCALMGEDINYFAQRVRIRRAKCVGQFVCGGQRFRGNVDESHSGSLVHGSTFESVDEFDWIVAYSFGRFSGIDK